MRKEEESFEENVPGGRTKGDERICGGQASDVFRTGLRGDRNIVKGTRNLGNIY